MCISVSVAGRRYVGGHIRLWWYGRPLRLGSPERARLRSSPMTQISMDVFEKEARDFLDANATKKEAEKKFVWGEGADKVAMFEEKDRAAELQDVRRACEWRAKKYDAGFGWISGPAKYGGRVLPNAYERLWNTLEGQYEVPNQSA